MENYPTELIPPESALSFPREIYKGFQQIGTAWLQIFISEAQLAPHERVLDVGCGIGRMAVPLTTYLSEKGEYFGFDIVSDGIDWCSQTITPKHSNFKFYLSNVYNKYYNPSGVVPANNYEFPHENNYFDFVFLTSVFTHMLPDDLEHYLSEIHRVLKTGGRCMITYLLLNEETSDLLSVRKSESGSTKNLVDVPYEIADGVFSSSLEKPEAAVAYRENIILALYDKLGFQITKPVYYGKWCGRKNGYVYQDMIFAVKP